jgi:hypothetical protein
LASLSGLGKELIVAAEARARQKLWADYEVKKMLTDAGTRLAGREWQDDYPLNDTKLRPRRIFSGLFRVI